MANIIIVIVSMAVLGLLFWKEERTLAILLALAYLARLAVLYMDYYHLMAIPFSGMDSEDFHTTTLAFLSGEDLIKTNYTYVLATIYWVFGPWGRMMSQFFNVLMSFGTVVLLERSLRLVKVTDRNRLIAVAVLSFMPATLCLSGVLLREAWVQFFLMLSLFFFVYWYIKGKVWGVFACLLATFSSMLMHAGCVGALAFYVLGFLICRTWKTDGVGAYLTTVGAVVVSLLVLILFPNLLLYKFVVQQSNGQSLDVPLMVTAGSSYLMWMKGLSMPMKVLLSPLKMFYLLFSPLPFDWRSLPDAMVFVVDSMVYVVLIILMFRRPLFQKECQLKRFLIYIILSLTFLYAMGTSNSGTAVRHRAKFVPVMLLAAAKKDWIMEN